MLQNSFFFIVAALHSWCRLYKYNIKYLRTVYTIPDVPVLICLRHSLRHSLTQTFRFSGLAYSTPNGDFYRGLLK